jgi:signal transduction histidine kinase
MVQRHTLLIVDGEPDVVQSLHDLLRREYCVLGATRAVAVSSTPGAGTTFTITLPRLPFHELR